MISTEEKSDEPDENVDIVGRELRKIKSSKFQPFETEIFNLDSIERVFSNNIDSEGQVISPEEFARELSDLVSTGFQQALDSGGEVIIDRAINTLAQATSRFVGTTADPANVRGLVNSLIKEFTANLLSKPPVDEFDISRVVDEIFGSELEALSSRNLSTDELNDVRLQLDKDLNQSSRTVQQLELLIQYLYETVNS